MNDDLRTLELARDYSGCGFGALAALAKEAQGGGTSARLESWIALARNALRDEQRFSGEGLALLGELLRSLSIARGLVSRSSATPRAPQGPPGDRTRIHLSEEDRQ